MVHATLLCLHQLFHFHQVDGGWLLLLLLLMVVVVAAVVRGWRRRTVAATQRQILRMLLPQAARRRFPLGRGGCVGERRAARLAQIQRAVDAVAGAPTGAGLLTPRTIVAA